jgi:hypothetical protein
MERLFSPCTRLFDDLQNQIHPVVLQELNLQELNLDVSTEDFLSAERAFTYADLHAMIRDRDTIAWLTPHTSIVCSNGRANQSYMQLHVRPHCTFTFDADGKEVVAWARSPEHLLEICDVVLRLLAASVVNSVSLINRHNFARDAALINAPTLSYMMEHCQSMKYLSLLDLEMDENHCRVLGAYSRPGLKIELNRCKLTSAGAGALAEVLGRNQGPTKLNCCDIDYCATADGLRGNSRLKSLKQDFSGDFSVRNRQILAIADAVRENKGLVELSIRCFGAIDAMNEETWGAVCDSLKTHPSLEVLNLQRLHMRGGAPPVVIISRMQALVDMVKVNTSIQMLNLDSHYSEHEIYRMSIIPYLETNRFRPRLLAIQKTRPIAYRAKVLGRALLAARTDANMFWMLLSGNAEVAFSSRTTTIAAASNLPTPATTAASETHAFSITATDNLPVAAATVCTNTVISSQSITSATIPPSPSDALPSAPTIAAAANVATPSAGQRRKACPQSYKD